MISTICRHHTDKLSAVYPGGVPRITAATVAEHRSRQRAELVRAAIDLLGEQGSAGVTLAAAGRRVGLARTSVYEYFSSNAQLLAAAVDLSFAQWAELVRAEVDGVTDPLDRIDAYVRSTLRLVAEGRHRPMFGVADPDPATRESLGRAHAQLLAPLQSALTELEVPEPRLTAALLQGIVNAAFHHLESGAPAEPVTQLAVDLVRACVRPAP